MPEPTAQNMNPEGNPLPPPNPNAPTEPSQGTPDLVELVVYGEPKRFDLSIPEQRSEYTKFAQKGVAADTKFQEAADTAKGAEAAVAMQKAFNSLLQDGDLEALQAIGQQYGIPKGEIDTIIQEARDSQAISEMPDFTTHEKSGLVSNDPTKRQGQGQGQGQPPEIDDRIVKGFQDVFKALGDIKESQAKPIDFGSLTDDMKRVVAPLEDSRINGIIEKVLDKDPELGYTMKNSPGNRRAAVLKLVREKCDGRLSQHNGDFGDGTRILSEVLPEIKVFIKNYDTPSDPTTPSMGIGPSPNQSSAGLYPGSKDPDPVSSKDPAFDRHIGDCIQNAMQKLDTSGR